MKNMSIGSYSVVQILSYFLIYSFLGWLIESTYKSVLQRRIINTGFLYGIVCPIYGIGAIIMMLALDSFKNNIYILFTAAFIVLTIWEYIVGVLLEKIFKRKYWDYSGHKFNIQGRVCLLNSFFWGVLGSVFTLYIHPAIQGVVNKVPQNILIYTDIVLYIAFITDVVKSIINHQTIAKQIKKLETISKTIKEKAKDIKQTGKEIVADEINKKIDDLKREQAILKMKLFRRIIKIKRAFPTMQSESMDEIIKQKSEILKIKNKIKQDKIKQKKEEKN